MNTHIKITLLCLMILILLVEAVTHGNISRFILHSFLRAFAVMEVSALKLVQRILPPRYPVVGECIKCGRCCKEIVFHAPKWIQKSRTMELFLAYHRAIHNFKVVGRGNQGEVIFSCNYLKSDNRCGIHTWRPFLCRNFPLQPWFEPPKILPYCSYQVAARPVTQMRSHPRLRVLNTPVAVHHPSPDDPTAQEHTHFHSVDTGHPY